MAVRERSRAIPATGVSMLTVVIFKDAGRFMAQCPQLDLVTEMDREADAVTAIIEMIREYAADYRKRIKIFSTSPNRAHHLPFVEKVWECRTDWDVRELLEVRYGHLTA